MDAKRDEAFQGPVKSQVGSLFRGLKIARLYKRNVSGRVIQPPETELWTVSFNIIKHQQNEEAFFPEIFKACACFLTHCFKYQFFSKMQIILTLHGLEF